MNIRPSKYRRWVRHCIKWQEAIESILVSLLYDEMQFHLYPKKHFEVSQTTETYFSTQ